MNKYTNVFEISCKANQVAVDVPSVIDVLQDMLKSESLSRRTFKHDIELVEVFIFMPCY